MGDWTLTHALNGMTFRWDVRADAAVLTAGGAAGGGAADGSAGGGSAADSSAAGSGSAATTRVRLAPTSLTDR